MIQEIKEFAVLIEALAMAASRHEAQARWLKPGFSAAQHDEKAMLMRRLRAQLMKQSRGPLT